MITRIANGNIVLPGSVVKKDIYIQDDTIRDITSKEKKFDRLIDATNTYILPGVIDAHTHLELQQGEHHTAGDFASNAQLAVSEGITSVIDYLPMEMEDIPSGEQFVNYSFHKVITSPVDYKYVKKYIGAGIPSFKIFTTYSDKGWMLNDGAIRDLMSHIKRGGGILEAHCENDGILEENSKKIAPETVNLSRIREPLSELEAVNRLCFLALATGVHLHIVHTTLPGSWDIIRSYRKKGAKVTWETCPQYLYLNDMFLEKRENYLYTFCPPMRDISHMKAMRDLVLKSKVDIITTDHCAFLPQQKTASKNLNSIPMGLPSIGYSLRLILELFGAPKNFPKVAGLLSAKPAELFGIKKRGRIKKGYYADLVIIKEISPRGIEMPRLSVSKYNPYEHVQSRWRVSHTLVNGEVSWESGEIKHLSGLALKRKL